ncbi:MAG: hypothetical protein K9K88_18775, partial [Desulfobacterales bacterium]|nr:hypothetical protein [Desulfobacterales bacterium]
VKTVLENPARRDAMVGQNYAVAARHYSYGVLTDQLGAILRQFFGTSVRLSPPQRMQIATDRRPEPESLSCRCDKAEPLPAANASFLR